MTSEDIKHQLIIITVCVFGSQKKKNKKKNSKKKNKKNKK